MEQRRKYLLASMEQQKRRFCARNSVAALDTWISWLNGGYSACPLFVTATNHSTIRFAVDMLDAEMIDHISQEAKDAGFVVEKVSATDCSPGELMIRDPVLLTLDH
jgi:hypothetical protein